MKQALLITAYKDLGRLVQLAGFFDDDFDIYVHVDKSSPEPLPDFAGRRVHVERTYRIAWGSERHLWAIDGLLRKAVASGPYACYHLITGSDFPIRPLKDFKNFFGGGGGVSYMEWHRLPRAEWPGNGGFDRVRRYWADSRCGLPAFTLGLLRLQRKLHFSRSTHGYAQWYGGGTYFSLTQQAAEVLTGVSRRRLHRWTRFTHCAEEIYPHTMLLNALPEEAVCNNSLRYAVWDVGAGSPHVLTEADFDGLAASGCFFARKLEAGVSDGLKRRIVNELLAR